MTASNRAAGFTLLEVLVTLAILSVGLIGLAAMQVVALKSNDTTGYRSVATSVASEMAERARANPYALMAGTPATGGFLGVDETDAAADCKQLPKPYCSSWRDKATGVAGETCTWQEMRNFDINVMYCGGAADKDSASTRTAVGIKMLPNGKMTITCNSDNCADPLGAQHLVTVTWDERVDNADGSTATETRQVIVPIEPISTPFDFSLSGGQS